MTETDLINKIDLMNSKGIENSYKLALTKDIDLVTVYTPLPTINDPDYYYLIKRDNKYIAIVYDMISDLHIFCKKDYRRQGIMFESMEKVILPYIMGNKERDIIWITVNDKSKNLFIKLGFIKTEQLKTEDVYYKLELTDRYNELKIKYKKLTHKQLSVIIGKLYIAKRIINEVDTEMSGYNCDWVGFNKNDMHDISESIYHCL